MIADVLKFVRKHLDDQLRAVMEDSPDEPGADKVVFVDGDAMDPIVFKSGAVSLLLINLEEERGLRSAEPYLRREDAGRAQRVQPDIRLNLHLIFVARFKHYDTSWAYLSSIIGYLQTMRVFDAQATPGIPPGVERLVFELATLTLAEQNEVWNALRTAHHPYLLYRVKLITFRDQTSTDVTEISTIETSVRRLP